VVSIKTNFKKGRIKRIKDVVKVLTEFGFGYIERVELKRKLPFLKQLPHYISLRELDSTVPERIRLVLEKLGSTYIKFGQILSTRQDLIGKDFVKELSKLQDNAPQFSYSIVESTIKEELGHPISYFLKVFRRNPSPLFQ